MIVSKIGDSLAVRLSAEDVARLGLREGDEVVLEKRPVRSTPIRTDPDGSYPPRITDPAERAAALVRLRRFRGILPDDFKFDREEANEGRVFVSKSDAGESKKGTPKGALKL